VRRAPPKANEELAPLRTWPKSETIVTFEGGAKYLCRESQVFTSHGNFVFDIELKRQAIREAVPRNAGQKAVIALKQALESAAA